VVKLKESVVSTQAEYTDELERRVRECVYSFLGDQGAIDMFRSLSGIQKAQNLLVDRVNAVAERVESVEGQMAEFWEAAADAETEAFCVASGMEAPGSKCNTKRSHGETPVSGKKQVTKLTRVSGEAEEAHGEARQLDFDLPLG
jgi:hypothetical protein